MFTGIIEDLGQIQKINTYRVSVKTRLNHISMGESVAVNGVCLTAVKIFQFDNTYSIIEFDLSQETLKKTGFNDIKANDPVNVERALKVGSKIGGHFVTGHVEYTGKILEINPSNVSKIYKIELPIHIYKYVVPKGSIAIDGISLTVVDVNSESFTVAIIPHTINNTVLKYKKVNSTVNLEPDIMAKYAQNAVFKQEEKPITESFLKEHGFV